MAVDIVEMDDLKHILKDTITAICRSRLHSAVQLSVEALIGVTINKSQMLLVNINEDLKSDVPVSVETQPRPAVSLPPRKNPKSFKGRSSTAHSFTSLRNPNRGRGKGLKSILPRLPIATQSSHADSQPPSSVQKEEEDSPPEKKSRSILLTAGDTYSPDTGELLPNPNNLIPLEPQFDTSLTDQPGNDEESEDNNKSQVGDMLPGIEGSRTEETSKPPPIADNKQASDRLMAGTNRQSSQGLQDEVGESIGTLSMVCDTDDSSTDAVRVKQEMPDYDDSFDQDQSPASGSGQPMFPSAKILDILNQPPRKMPRECRKRKILTLETRIQVLEMLQTGRSARSIATQLGVGRTQIQNILKEKDLIVSKWIQGASSDMKYINPRRRPYADVDNLVWQWFQAYSSCGVHITGKLIQQTALELAKELGNQKFSASNGWLESWQRRHNVKLSAMYEAHKTKSSGGESDPNATTGSEDGGTAKSDISGEVPGSESESFFKSGNDVIMETDSSDESGECQRDGKDSSDSKRDQLFIDENSNDGKSQPDGTIEERPKTPSKRTPAPHRVNTPTSTKSNVIEPDAKAAEGCDNERSSKIKGLGNILSRFGVHSVLPRSEIKPDVEGQKSDT